MLILSKLNQESSECGGALVTSMTLIATMAGLSGAIMLMGVSSKRELENYRSETRALYMAQAGIADGLAMLQKNLQQDETLVDKQGTEDDPRSFSLGNYWVTSADNGDGTYTIRATGRAHAANRTIEAIAVRSGGGVYANALFAGNTSGDQSYTLELGGYGGQADTVFGDVYSGADAHIGGHSSVSGVVRAKGEVTGIPGMEGNEQIVPDMMIMDYENNHDFNVADLFAGASWEWDSAGGWAQQVSSSNPAHIFRRNPDDRSSEVNSTEKDDYFLEDPYESVRSDSSSDGSDAYRITVAGLPDEAGSASNEHVYFIDGNLWIHNYHTYSMMFESTSSMPINITFVVKGNIYMSDNLFYEDSDRDGVALIAIQDEDVVDSGNIYFGDPEFGTLEHMDSYMYAQNNFYDYNLDEWGSAEVTVFGNMTAGNQVQIERDWGDQHSKLEVIFDPRLSAGELALPGIPIAEGELRLQIVGWRELSTREAKLKGMQKTTSGLQAM